MLKGNRHELRTWLPGLNGRNVDELSRWELNTVVEDADTMDERGYPFNGRNSQWSRTATTDAFSAGSGDERHRSLRPIHPIAFGDLSEAHPKLRRPIIEGLLRVGETGNCISHTKAGKSWLATTLLLAIATGRDWLGRFNVSQGRILLIDNELHRETLVNRVHRVAEKLKIAEGKYAENIEVVSLRGRLRDVYGLLPMLQDVEPETYQLIILDAWYRILPAGTSENDNAQIAAVYNELDVLTDHLKCGLWCVHHSTKGLQSDRRVTDVGSGASSQARAADTHVILREHQQEDHVTMDWATRSWAPPEPLVLRWEYPLWHVVEDVDPEALKQPTSRGDKNRQARDREGITAVATALKKHGPLTRRKLRNQVGMGQDRVNRLLMIMKNTGDVEWTDQDGTELVGLR